MGTTKMYEFPKAMPLMSGFAVRENLQRSLHGETPVVRPRKADHRLKQSEQRGRPTPHINFRVLRALILSPSVKN